MFDKLNKIDQLYAQSLLEKCKGCKGIDNCVQEMVGLQPKQHYDKHFDMYRLSFKKCDLHRGKYNTELIKNYEQWSADNREEILLHIKEYNNIYLQGDVGLGKTHFLYWLANVFNKRGKNVYIDFFSSISKNIKEEMNRKMEYDEESFTNFLKNVDYLFIDDLGNEYSTEYIVSEILLPIIDYRYVNKKPTFITSNYTLNELYGLYGKKIKDEVVAQKKVRPLISRLKTFGEIEIKSKNWRV